MPLEEGTRRATPLYRAILWKTVNELGILALYRSPLDVKLLCFQRFVRLFAYGTTALILVPILRALDLSQGRIGLFMTLTLVGDAVISLVLSAIADVVGRRVILVSGALLMVLSGIAFARSDDFWVLLFAAIVGVVSANGNEIGPFRAIEESTLAHLTDPVDQGDLYAWYCVVGYLGQAAGIMTCGWVINHLTQDLAWQPIEAYRVAFYGYALFGLTKALLAFCLTPSVEADTEEKGEALQPSSSTDTNEEAPLLRSGPDTQEPETLRRRGWLPKFSKETLKFLPMLCFLLSLDNFGTGLVPTSWVSYYFRLRFNLPDGKLGSVFSSTLLVNAASTLVASSLAKRFGNVKTMVFAHLPSSIFLSLIPAPNQMSWAVMFLVLRSCTQSMDTAPRSAFLASILLPGERTAIIGLLNVIKTTSQSLGPLATGILAEHDAFWVVFICAGTLKMIYDLGLLVRFNNYKRPVSSSGEE